MEPYATDRRTIIQAALAASVLARAATASGTQDFSAVVETSAGRVRGVRMRGVDAFRGIPYGADTKPHRFQAALPPEPWIGVRDSLAFGPQSPQLEFDPRSAAPGSNMSSEIVRQVIAAGKQGMQVGNESEDCLVLNVFTPDASHRVRRPVMVWLHGGGFAIGSAGDPQYDGSALARRGDVVVVSINHRLNAFGYLYLAALHPDFADSGNVGQLDIVLALRWVRDNIAAFGGDAGNVTIFGESGGGAKVSTMLAMPAARGLFHKGIIQSGPSLRAVPQAVAAVHAERTLATLGIAPADVHRLQTIDREALLKAAGAAQKPGERVLAPVVDGHNLPGNPFDPAAPDTARGVAVMVGTCATEGTLFLSADPLFGKMDEAQARQRAARMNPKGAAAIDLYKRLRPDDPPTYWLTAMATDAVTWIDSIRLAERKVAQGQGSVFMYRLDWRSPMLGGLMRSPHGLDVPLMFDNVAARPLLLGSGHEPQRLADVMSTAWINFARGADPSQPGLAWPAYDLTKRETMIFDTMRAAVADPDAEVRRFWS